MLRVLRLPLCIALATFLSFSRWASAAPPVPTAESWQWVAPAALKLATANLSRIEKQLEPQRAVSLSPGQILLIPARRGDQFSLLGGPVAAGIATGLNGQLPDAITWRYEVAPAEIRIPTWSPIRFLALRAEEQTQISVRVAAGVAHPLADYRLNDRVYRWLAERGQNAPPPFDRQTAPLQSRGSDQAAGRHLDILQGLSHWMQIASSNSPETREVALYWLHSQWLEQSLHRRELKSPFFVGQPLVGAEHLVTPSPAARTDESTLQGSASVTNSQWGDGWMVLRADQPLVFPPTNADVYRILVRAQSVGHSALDVFAGESRLERSVFRVARRNGDPERWTPARTIRVIPHGRPLRLQLVQGAVRVKIDGYVPRFGIADPRQAHDLKVIPNSSFLPESPWLESLWNLQLQPDDDHRHALWQQYNKLHNASSPKHRAQLALLLYKLLPTAHARPDASSQWKTFWGLTAGLADDLRDALRLGVLQRALRHSHLPLPTEWSPAIQSSAELSQQTANAVLSTRQLLVSSLLESLFTPLDRQRPGVLYKLDAGLARQLGDRQANVWMRQAWSRTSPWATLKPRGAQQRLLIRTLSEQPGRSGLCSTYGNLGLRWWKVPAAPRNIEVQDLGGTHSVLLFRPLDDTQWKSSGVSISGIPIVVHPLLAEPSRAAVVPGRYTISHGSGPPVVAKIPWKAQLPCSQLREGELWTDLDGKLQYELPPGDTATIASFIVHPDSQSSAAIRLIFQVGEYKLRGEVRPSATGNISFVIPAHARIVTVSSSRPILIRGRIRLHPAHLAASLEPGEQPLATRQQQVKALRHLTVQVDKAASPPARDELRVARGDILFSLGYRSLAYRQWLRGQVAPSQRQRSAPGALFLPHRTESVLALGLPARAPRLPDALSNALLPRVHALQQSRRPEKALELLLQSEQLTQAGPAALLAARLTSRGGNIQLAALLYERLAHQSQATVFSQAAAIHYDQLAQQHQRLDYAQRAYALARASAPEQAAIRGLLGRYEPLVQWRAPSLSALGQTTLTVSSQQREFRPRSFGNTVQRALLNAPDNARLLYASTSTSLTAYREKELKLQARCMSRQSDREVCAVELRIDELPIPCAALSNSPIVECTIPIPPQAQRLHIDLPAEGKPVAWLQLKNAAPDSPSSLAKTTRYARLPVGYAAPLQLQGPAALRLRVRSLGAAPAQLEVRTTAKSGTPLPLRLFSLTAARDKTAQLGSSSELISREERFAHVVLGAGPHTITLRALGAALAVRPEVAQLMTPPALIVENPVAATPLPLVLTQNSSIALADVNNAPRGLPLASGLSVLIKDRDLSDTENDRRDRYIQLTSQLRKRVVGQPIWLSSQGFARFRQGPMTLGLRTRAELRLKAIGLGGSATVRGAYQPALRATGWGANLALTYRSKGFASWPLQARARFSYRTADPSVRIARGVDSQIYSAYANLRSRSWDLELLTRQRPFLDTRLSYGAALRMDPNLKSVDRVSAATVLHSLGGRSWAPWLRLAFGAGYRPTTTFRKKDFLRWKVAPRATIWHWLTPKQRVRTDLSLAIFVDAPGENYGMFFALSAGFEQWGKAGLGEQSPSALPYRERLEENGPLLQPRAPASDTLWKQEQHP